MTDVEMLPPSAPLGEVLYNNSKSMEFPTMMMEEVVFLEGPRRMRLENTFKPLA